MFSMLKLCIKTYLTLTKINKYYIYDDQSLLICFSSLIFWVWLFVTYGTTFWYRTEAKIMVSSHP